MSKQPVLILSYHGAKISLSRLSGESLAVEDAHAGTRIGEVEGQIGCLGVEIQGAPYVIVAGLVTRTEVRAVRLRSPEQTDLCPVRAGAWMNFPRVFSEQMRFTIEWLDEHNDVLDQADVHPRRWESIQTGNQLVKDRLGDVSGGATPYA